MQDKTFEDHIIEKGCKINNKEIDSIPFKDTQDSFTNESTDDFGQKEVDTIKLIRNTKGYNFEIKICGFLDSKQLDRLDAINERMKVKYG